MSPRVFILAVALTTAAACGSSPTPPPPPPAAPTVSCPASISFESPDNVPMPASFTVPTASGGQSPVTVTCSAQSGANFPLGSTLVTCTATDSLQRTATCNFNVAVTPSPRISKTKFLAFGDSITYGRCHVSPQECDPYTVRLRQLLEGRYTKQSFTITTSGAPGENASDDIEPTPPNIAGQDRLPRDLDRYNPEVLLLMEGTNDLINGPPDQAVDLAAQALDRMVTRARERGVEVFLATIPPQRYPPPPGTRDRTGSGALVQPLNDRIRTIATNRGAHLVDIYAAMNADLAGTISVDNLHPTELGLRVMGETFYAAIREKLDNTPTPSSSLFIRR
jgi:lysophospholipase L1-like esterase